MNTRCIWKVAFTSLLLATASVLAAADGAVRIASNKSDATSAAISTQAKITASDFTVELWLRPSEFHGEDHFFSQDLVGDVGRLMLCLVNGKPRFQIGDTQLNTTTVLPLNEWTHLAFRRISGTMIVYINGVKYNTTAKNTSPIADTTIVLGKLRRNNQTYTGELSEVRVWGDRNDATIKANFMRRVKGNESGLLYCWPMDDGSGTTCRELVSGKTATVEKTAIIDWSETMLPLVLSKQTLTGDCNDRLLIGDGTLVAPADSNYALKDGYELNARNGGAAVLRVERNATLTVEGEVSYPDSSAGGFIKTGDGTLVYSGAGDVGLAAHTQNAESEVNIDSRGIGPTTGYHCAAVADGTLVINKQNATVSVANGGVGRFMTGVMHKEDGQIAAGHVIVSNGTLKCGIVGLGYLGSWTASASDEASTFTVEGGVVESVGALRLGKANCAFNMNGGRFVNPTNQCPYFMGGCNVPGVKRVVNLNGGTFVASDFTLNAACGSGVESILNFNGAVWEANNPVEYGLSNDNGYKSYVGLGGAKFDCSKISERLALYLTMEHDPALGATKDGGLSVLGGMLVYRSSNCTYTGDTVVESGAILAVSPNGSVAIPGLTIVREGGRLHPNDATPDMGVRTAGLTVEDGGILSLPVNISTGANGWIDVTGDSPALGAGFVEFVDGIYGTEHYYVNGTFKVLAYRGEAPDVSKMRVYELPEGKMASFAAANGVVTVTIAADIGGAAEWTKDGDGDFADNANWNKALSSGCDVSFGGAITGDRTVTTAGETVGVLGFNNAEASYTLDGTGLTVNKRVQVDAGEHVVTAPLTLGGDAVVMINPDARLTVGEFAGEDAALTISGGGLLGLAELPTLPITLDNAGVALPDGSNWNLPNVTIPQGKTGEIAVDGTATVSGIQGPGTLKSQGGVTFAGPLSGLSGVEIGSGKLTLSSLPGAITLGNAALEYTGPAGASATALTANPGTGGKAAVIKTDVDLDLTGRYELIAGALVKRGTGNLTLHNTLANRESVIGSANAFGGDGAGNPVWFDLASQREGLAPAYGFSGCTVENGTLTIKDNVFSANKSMIAVGSSTVPNGETEKSATFVVDGAKLHNLNQLHVGWCNYTTDVTAEAPSSKLILSNGEVVVDQLFIAHGKTNVVARTKPTAIVEGGTLTVASLFNFGAWNYAPSADSVASFVVNGGTVRLPNMQFGSRAATGGAQIATYFEQNGGTVIVTNDVVFGYNLSRATLQLNGGTFEANRIINTGTTYAQKIGHVYFNGVTFVPLKDSVYSYASGVTAGGIFMQEGGLTIDLSKLGAGKYHGFTSTIKRDPSLSAGVKDGGLTVRGPSDRYLDVASGYLQFEGPIRLEGGYCKLMPRMTNDLYVAKGANVTMRELDTGSVGEFMGDGSVTNAPGHQTGVLNVYGTFHSQGAVIDNLVLKPGAKIACDGACVATVLKSLEIDASTVVDFTGRTTQKGESFALLDVGSSSVCSYPRSLKVVNTGLDREATLRVDLSVENGVLMGLFRGEAGTVLVVR